MDQKNIVLFTINKISYVISQKSGVTYIFFHNYAGIKIDSYDVLIIKLVFNKNQN